MSAGTKTCKCGLIVPTDVDLLNHMSVTGHSNATPIDAREMMMASIDPPSWSKAASDKGLAAIGDAAIKHPPHYGGDTTYETIKVIEAWSLGFNLGNALKYISRAGKKDPTEYEQDLKKAAFYLAREIASAKKARP
jgi:hypothetical protein